jgi:hypothetical protein
MNAAQETILNDNNVLLLFTWQVQGKPFFYCLYIECYNPKFLVQCLILVPSRELGLQIEQVWKKWVPIIK